MYMPFFPKVLTFFSSLTGTVDEVFTSFFFPLACCWAGRSSKAPANA